MNIEASFCLIITFVLILNQLLDIFVFKCSFSRKIVFFTTCIFTHVFKKIAQNNYDMVLAITQANIWFYLCYFHEYRLFNYDKVRAITQANVFLILVLFSLI